MDKFLLVLFLFTMCLLYSWYTNSDRISRQGNWKGWYPCQGCWWKSRSSPTTRHDWPWGWYIHIGIIKYLWEPADIECFFECKCWQLDISQVRYIHQVMHVTGLKTIQYFFNFVIDFFVYLYMISLIVRNMSTQCMQSCKNHLAFYDNYRNSRALIG